MNVVFGNRAESFLASAISAGGTSIAITAGDGGKFPAAEDDGAWFPLVLANLDGDYEIVYVTRHEAGSDVLTVLRGQEGTAARNWPANAKAMLAVTAQVMKDMQENIMALTQALRNPGGRECLIEHPVDGNGVNIDTGIAADTSHRIVVKMCPTGGTSSFLYREVSVAARRAGIVYLYGEDKIQPMFFTHKSIPVDDMNAGNDVPLDTGRLMVAEVVAGKFTLSQPRASGLEGGFVYNTNLGTREEVFTGNYILSGGGFVFQEACIYGSNDALLHRLHPVYYSDLHIGLRDDVTEREQMLPAGFIAHFDAAPFMAP